MSLKDGGLCRPDLAGDFRIERMQVVGGGIAGSFVMGQLRHHLFGFQLPSGRIDEDFVDAIGRANDDAR